MVDLRKIWNGISVNLLDCLTPDQLTIVQQACYCELGKYNFTEKVDCTELATYDDDKLGYTMFFCSKGVEGLSKRSKLSRLQLPALSKRKPAEIKE